MLEQARIPVAVIGMLTAVVGVFLGNKMIVWAAIGVLGIAMLLRMVRRRDSSST